MINTLAVKWEGYKNTERYGSASYIYKKDLLTTDEVANVFDLVGNNLNYFISYPDVFLDIIKPAASKFSLFFYQRIYLRVAMRFRYVFSTFTRAFSKSFLSILVMILRCVFLPGSKVFICAEVKEQAARIAKEKILEIFNIWPLLENETYLKSTKPPKGMGCSMAKDYVELWFKNSSNFQVVGMANSTRGGRRHAGIIEEVRDIDSTELNEVILPLMNINRRTGRNEVNKKEPHQAQLFVTTADHKGTFAYEKLMEILSMSVIKPRDYFVWSGSYEIPVMHGLLDGNYIEEIKLSNTYEEDSFAREYLSIWTGGDNSSFFTYDKLTGHRIIVKAEDEFKVTTNREMFYLLSVDVARLRAETVIQIFKIMPNNGAYRIKLVNSYVLQGMHFMDQAMIIKQLAGKFKAEEIVIDGSGLGVGLLDFMIIDNHDNAGNVYPPVGVINDEDYLAKQPKYIDKKIYVVKSANKADDIHLNMSTYIASGKVEFLISEREAKAKLVGTPKAKEMYYADKIKYLLPYKLTTALIEESSNWRQKKNSNKISLEKINPKKSSDKFSAFEYGLYRLAMKETEYMKEYNKRNSKRKIRVLIN